MTPKGVLVAFEKSCGAEFVGFVAKETKTEEDLVLEVGVALKHSAFLCSAGLETIVMKFPALVANKYSNIKELEVTSPTPLLLARVYQIGFSNGKLLGLAENRCGSFMGTLLRPFQPDTSEARIEVGLVHQAPKKGQAATCQPAPLIRPLVKMSRKGVSQIQPWHEKKPQISASYSIHTKEIESSKSGTYRYLLGCNEAPIGIAESMDGLKQQKVVVARYYNRPCPEGLPRQQYESFSFEGLPLEPSETLTARSGATTVHREAGWQIQPMVPRPHKRKATARTYRYWNSCSSVEANKFIVWTRDPEGRLSVGLMTPREESNPERCMDSTYPVGTFKEIELNNIDQEIMPLRLRHIYSS